MLHVSCTSRARAARLGTAAGALLAAGLLASCWCGEREQPQTAEPSAAAARTEAEEVEAAVKGFEGARDEEQRIDALQELAFHGGPGALRAARAALEDEDLEVRETAVELLEDVGGDEAIEMLGLVLAREPDLDLKLRALDALRFVEGAGASRAIAQALRDSSPEIREEAAYALADLGDPGAVGPLREAVDRERDPDVRQVMQEALEDLAAGS